MENHNFSWENSLFLWPFSIATLNYQRVPLIFGILWVTSSTVRLRDTVGYLVSVSLAVSIKQPWIKKTFYNCNPQEREYIPPYWGLVMICNIWVISGSCMVLFLCTGTYEDKGSAPSAFLDTHLLSLPTYSWGLLADVFFDFVNVQCCLSWFLGLGMTLYLI